MKKIKKLHRMVSYTNNSHFEYMIFPEFDSETNKKSRQYCLEELKTYKTKIIYDDNSEYILPTTEIIEILPDRSGFIVIYDEKPCKFSKERTYPWFCKAPNNAAVYNADGSLRFQINNPFQDTYIQGFAQESINYPDFLSVILNVRENPITGFHQLFAVNPNSPDLIDAKQQIMR